EEIGRLAALSGSRPPEGMVLLAEIEREPVAAIGLFDGQRGFRSHALELRGTATPSPASPSAPPDRGRPRPLNNPTQQHREQRDKCHTVLYPSEQSPPRSWWPWRRRA